MFGTGRDMLHESPVSSMSQRNISKPENNAKKSQKMMNLRPVSWTSYT